MMLEDLYRLLKSGHVQAQGVVDTITQPIVVLDELLRISTANNAFIKAFQVERDDVIDRGFFSLGNGQWDIPDLRALFASIIPKSQAVVGYEVKHDFPGIGRRTFLVDARRLVRPDDNSTSILVQVDDVTERQRRDTEKDLMLSETRHRMRNLFAVIRSLAMQMTVDGLTALEYRERFLTRLDGTLRVQEIAATSEPLELGALVRQVVGEQAFPQVIVTGPAIPIHQPITVSLGMIFHELATNSAKYGALSVSEGRVHVTWSLDGEHSNGCRIRCVWLETNGPSVEPLQRNGFGTQMMARVMSHMQGSMELDYGQQGFGAVMNFRCEAA
jgi:two-component sensor histidine kinase